MLEPYYADDRVVLYQGDCRELLPQLPAGAVAAVVDPPYVETSAGWDRWPAGWIEAVTAHLPPDTALWCYGSMRTHLTRAPEFRAAGWKYGPDVWQLWEKANGTGPGSRDRPLRVHEIAVQWHRGRWGALHHEWPRQPVHGASKGTVRKKARQAPHQHDGRPSSWEDDGFRQPRSVHHVQHVQVPSVRFAGRHQDEKPLGAVMPLVRECTPPGMIVLDPMAGACTVGVAARLLGRQAVLIEADEATCETGARRLAEAAHETLDLDLGNQRI